MIEELLDLAGIDVLAAANDHILDATRDAVVALFILDAQVATVKEAILVDYLGGGLGVVVIALHRIVAAVAHLALYANGAFLACLGVDHPHFRKLIIAADGSIAYLRRIVDPGVGHTRRSFG